MKSSKC